MCQIRVIKYINSRANRVWEDERKLVLRETPITILQLKSNDGLFTNFLNVRSKCSKNRQERRGLLEPRIRGVAHSFYGDQSE